MSESNLTEAHNALQERLLSLYHKREQLEDDLQQVKVDQASVREAIIKLGHKPSKSTKKRKFRPTAELIAFMAEMRLCTGPLPKKHLKEEIEQMLAQRGHSIKGYSKAFREAISSPQFKCDEEDDVVHVIDSCDEPYRATDIREFEVEHRSPREKKKIG